MLLMITGRSEEAIAEARKALELEPFVSVYNLQLGATHIWARQYDKAIQQYEKTVALDSNNPWGWDLMGTTFLL